MELLGEQAADEPSLLFLLCLLFSEARAAEESGLAQAVGRQKDAGIREEEEDAVGKPEVEDAVGKPEVAGLDSLSNHQ